MHDALDGFFLGCGFFDHDLLRSCDLRNVRHVRAFQDRA
jgi:hypothetical protein